ncbi:MAG: hypothetical protein J2P24_02790 [Streptosporangiales bacterium]|nr:hypothetical protein [Streptosporangiales bacterium]
MISAGARRLYTRLLAIGPADPAEVGLDRADPRIQELLDRGFARYVAEKLLAVPPRNARSDAALAACRQLQSLAQDAMDVERYLELVLAPARAGSADESNDLVEFIDSAAEVSLLSGTLPRQASRSVRAIHTALFPAARSSQFGIVGPTAEDVSSGIQYRVIYSQAFVEDGVGRRVVETAAAGGEETRTHPKPPLKIKIIDGSVTLVPVDDTGEAGALLVKSAALTRMFVDYFEKMWAESRPLGDQRSHMLSPLEVRMLSFWADDVNDLAIARRLSISERSLRRHARDLLAKLGAQTRSGALALAMRRGLVS